MASKQVEELKSEVKRLEKINKALRERVEEATNNSESAFSLFEGNIALTHLVRTKTAELEQSGKALELERTKISNLLAGLPGGIATFDGQLQIHELQLNQIPQGVLGFLLSDGKREFRNDFKKYLMTRLKTLECEPLNSQQEVGIDFAVTRFDYSVQKSGEKHVLGCSVTRLSREVFLLFFTDESRVYRQQEVIREQQALILQAARLSSLGEIAGNIAHEINTPLANLLLLAGRLETLSAKGVIDEDAILTAAQRVRLTVERISKTVNGLRQMVRIGENDAFEEVYILDAINDAIELCDQKIKLYSIELNIDIDPRLSVYGRRVQLAQVFLNLLSNSIYAVREQDSSWISLQSVEEELSIKIIFQDSGNGIPEEVEKKIFEPFFTTKQTSDGTGLGMSISKRIVEEHQGQIDYLTVNGHTCFEVQLNTYLKAS